MKNVLKYSVFVLAMFAAFSCNRDELSDQSIIQVSLQPKNDFDLWLDANFVTPYNISVKWRYDQNETSLSYYTIPADLDCSITMAHLIKYLCIDSYDEVAGVLFTQHYFPKMFTFIGEWEYNNAGTIRLGTAEGGKKINLTGINYLPKIMAGQWGDYRSDPTKNLNHYYIKTIHHEFTHILNQTKDYPVEFTQVTPTTYVTESWSTSNYNTYYRQRGYVSTYAQHSDREDFAEVLSLYVTNSEETLQGWLADAGREVTETDMSSTGNSHYAEFHASFPDVKAGDHFDGDKLIEAKIAQVRKYMADTFNIDIDQLRAAVLRRQGEVMAGEVDLTSLEVD